jgi:hypothetical protein
VLLCEEVLVQERGDTYECTAPQIDRGVAYRFSRGKGAAINENAESGKELTLVFVKQVVTPVYSVA